MNLEQYAAQQAHEPQQAPQAQETLTVEQVAAKLDAEKLSSLMAQMQEAIEEKIPPAAMLEAITSAMFGTGSPQAAAVTAIIDADKHPGGHELAIADIRQQRSLLKKYQKLLEEQGKAVAAAIARLDEAERELTLDRSAAAMLDTALTETLTFCKTIDVKRDMLKEIKTLYNRHRGNHAAMGLLYGGLKELTRQQLITGELDLIQQQELERIKERIAAAI